MKRYNLISNALGWLMFLLVVMTFFCQCRLPSERGGGGDTIVVIAEKDTIGKPMVVVDMPDEGVERLAYSLSYNQETMCPNWVMWKLTSEHLDYARMDTVYDRNGVPFLDEKGEAYGISRFDRDLCRNHYIVDMEMSAPRPTHEDWKDLQDSLSHGHLCPAADCDWSPVAQNQAALLSNICPQTAKLNTGSWNRLEMKCRDWANRYGEIYIVAGPIFDNHHVTKTMGENRVAVPDWFFKVVLCMTPMPKAIGFVYRNDTASHNMEDAVCSVDSVEKCTGINFFPLLPNAIEDAVESHADLREWQ